VVLLSAPETVAAVANRRITIKAAGKIIVFLSAAIGILLSSTNRLSRGSHLYTGLPLVPGAGDADRLPVLCAHIALEDVLMTQAAFHLVERPFDLGIAEIRFRFHFKQNLVAG
jgi:hypothetical protein